MFNLCYIVTVSYLNRVFILLLFLVVVYIFYFSIRPVYCPRPKKKKEIVALWSSWSLTNVPMKPKLTESPLHCHRATLQSVILHPPHLHEPCMSILPFNAKDHNPWRGQEKRRKKGRNSFFFWNKKGGLSTGEGDAWKERRERWAHAKKKKRTLQKKKLWERSRVNQRDEVSKKRKKKLRRSEKGISSTRNSCCLPAQGMRSTTRFAQRNFCPPKPCFLHGKPPCTCPHLSQ